MGAGFYLMVAASIVMARIALADRRRGWLWAGVTLCVTTLLGKFFGLSVLIVCAGFVATFLIMILSNVVSSNQAA